MSEIPKGVMLKGLEKQMYMEYKISSFARGMNPLEFDKWKETLNDNDHIPKIKKEKTKPIEYTAPEKKRNRDSKSVNKKLKEYWGEEQMTEKEERKLLLTYERAAEKLGIGIDTTRSYVYQKKLDGNSDGVYFHSVEEYIKNRKPSGRPKDIIKVENQESKEEIIVAQTVEEKPFVLSREELLEFGKAAFERGRNSVSKLSAGEKDSLLDEICFEKVS